MLRHAERLVSHDVVLRELAERRARVYADLVPLVPGRLGPRRGDLLTRVVDDVDALLEDRLRVRQPVATAALVGTGVALVTGLLHPAAGAVALAVSAAGAIAFVLARRAATASEELLVARRAALGTSVEEVAHGLRELEQWGATDRALVAVRSESDALAGAVRRSARAVAAGTALTSAAAGLGVIAVAASVSPGSVSPAVLALLLLVPLALADVTAGLADAGALSVRARAARERLDRLAHTPRLSPTRRRPCRCLPPTVSRWSTWGSAGATRDSRCSPSSTSGSVPASTSASRARPARGSRRSPPPWCASSTR